MLRFVSILIVLGFVGCQPAPPRAGQTSPNISGHSFAGKPVALSDYRGRVVVLDFWATWCVKCRKQLPELVDFATRFDGKPVVVLGINCDHDIEKAREFVKVNPLPWPNIFDGFAGPIAMRFAANELPALFVIDQKGIIRFQDVHGKKLIQVTEELLAEAK